MTTETSPPILDLDELDEPAARIRVDGAAYDLRAWDALTLREQNRMRRQYARLFELEDAEEASDEDDAEYRQLTREIVVLVSSMDDETAAATAHQKLYDLALFYFGSRVARQTRAVGEMARTIASPGSPTGARSSRASRGSTRRSASTRG